LLALVIVLQLFGSSVRIGPTSFSLVLIPIAVGGILLGKGAGAFLGFVFGLITLIAGITGTDVFTQILFQDHPFLTSLVCLGKGMAAGFGAGLIYQLLMIPRRSEWVQWDDSLVRTHKRNVGVCMVLSIITLGLYGIYWMYLLVKNTRSVQKITTNCVGEMLCLIFVPFYSLYWWYTNGEKVKQQFGQRNHTLTGNGVVYLLLAILGLSIVSMAIMQSDFNSLESESRLEQPAPIRKIGSVFGATAIAPILNTGLFILGALLMSDTLSANFVADGSTVIYFLVIGCAGINFIVEFLVNLVVSPGLYQAVNAISKRIK